MQAKIAAKRFHNAGQLPLVTPTFGHQMGHNAAWFLPTEVRVLKFRAADVCAKYGEKHWNDGFLNVF